MKFTSLCVAGIALTAFAASAQTVSDGGVLNAASNAVGQPVVAGSLVSIYGSDLASTLTQSNSIPLSTNLNGTTVSFGGVAAPLLFVAGNQINAQVPWEVTGTSTQLVVSQGSAHSTPVTVPLTPAAPGIFATATNQAIAYGNSDYAFAAPVGALGASHPAKIGDPTTLVILATGLGAVTPPITSGNIPPAGQYSSTVATPTVTVGGVPAQVVFSGIVAYVGVYQVNIIIQPGTPTGDAIPLQITMNGIKSNGPTIAVSN